MFCEVIYAFLKKMKSRLNKDEVDQVCYNKECYKFWKKVEFKSFITMF